MTRTTTRPEQPTNRASSKVKKPIPGPGSSTVMHWRTCDSSTLAGRCPKRAPGWPPRKSRGSSAGHEGRSEDLARRTAQVLLKTTVTQAEDRLFPTGIPDSTQHPILVQRPPNPNRDHARVAGPDATLVPNRDPGQYATPNTRPASPEPEPRSRPGRHRS